MAFDSEAGDNVAVKIEFPSVRKAVLKLEIAILKRLSFCNHICTFIAGGRFIAPHLLSKGQDPNDHVHTYLVMNLLSSSISDLRKKRANGAFSLHTTCLLGIQMVAAIQAVHSTGVLHRDIKPGNFCIAKDTKEGEMRPLCHLIDFGLSRRYLNSTGSIREERTNVGFRGTARYASIAAHCGKELGRVDDLWSLFYMTVEFLEGTLPWKGKEKDKIGDYKQKYTKEKLVRNLPVQMTYYLHYLQSLGYESTPDYAYITTLYQEMQASTKRAVDTPYDWDMDGLADVHGTCDDLSISVRPTTNPDQSLPMLVDGEEYAIGAATAAEPPLPVSVSMPMPLKKMEPRPPAVSAPESSFHKFSFTRAAVGKRLTRSFTLLSNKN